ncbi:hypothetical protein E6Q11_01835 [Candidatus Dojkabacteria bacterium]|uniref:Uncharacterized protein n=1 Tax=Candidatus Dojkabacteria bacterium TaxID=2099670 RepID=A0A5C7J8X7_9BACT|nr:MAG: hypothetical protein E6Q11_01835 [Candidatus Dojkabacteria bacterium]
MGGVVSDLFGGGGQQASADMSRGYQLSAEERARYLQQIQDLLNPSIAQGNQAMSAFAGMLPGLGAQFSAFANPGAGKTWMDSYKESPYAAYMQQQAAKAINNGASASGMIGSGANLRNLGTMANQISSQDMQNYYNNMMGLGNMYMGGQQQLMNNGLNSVNSLGNYMFNTGQGTANDIQNEYGTRAAGDVNNSGMWHNLISLGASFL